MNHKVIICISKDYSFSAAVSDYLQHGTAIDFRIFCISAISEISSLLTDKKIEAFPAEIVFVIDLTGKSAIEIQNLPWLIDTFPASLKVAFSPEETNDKISRNFSIPGNLVIFPENFMATGFDPILKLLKIFISEHDISKANSAEASNRGINTEKSGKIISGLLETIQVKEKLFSLLSHDLKDPLLAINGIAGILVQEWEVMPEEEKLEIVNEILKSSRKTSQLVNNISAWSKSITKRINLESQVSGISDVLIPGIEIADQFENGKSVMIRNEVDPDILFNIDRNLISTVFRNLLLNAVKYTPKGGEIVINAEKKEGFYQFCISNSDRAIESQCILEYFSRESYEAASAGNNTEKLGFGLLFCKEFVEKNGGHIWLESEKETGTRFYFTVPC